MKFLAAILLLLTLLSCIREPKPDRAKSLPVAETASRMQELVVSLSKYAKKRSHGFLIVPQNASKLLYIGGDPYASRHPEYANSIDALGIEGLFYSGAYEPDSLRIAILDTFSKQKKVFVADYVKDNSDVPKNRAMIKKHGFIPFVRSRENFDYVKIPKHSGTGLPPGGIGGVSDYLYLINGSQYPDKEHFIQAVSQSRYQMAIIDLFFHEEAFTRSEVERMKRMPSGGNRIVLGYVNIGAAENWRYYWNPSWKIGFPEFLARPYHGYKDEAWVHFWDPEWKKILFGNPGGYLDRLIDSGFDGAYLDNVEAYLYLYAPD